VQEVELHEGNKFARRAIFANAGLNADLGIEKTKWLILVLNSI